MYTSIYKYYYSGYGMSGSEEPVRRRVTFPFHCHYFLVHSSSICEGPTLGVELMSLKIICTQ